MMFVSLCKDVFAVVVMKRGYSVDDICEAEHGSMTIFSEFNVLVTNPLLVLRICGNLLSRFHGVPSVLQHRNRSSFIVIVDKELVG